MLARQMRARRQRHKPLTRIRIGPPIRHDQQPLPVHVCPFTLQSLICKCPAIYTLAAGPVLLDEVAALDHEAVNDAVDGGGFVVQFGGLFARAQRAEAGD